MNSKFEASTEALAFSKYSNTIWENPEFIQKSFSDFSFSNHMHPKKSFFTITPHTYDKIRTMEQYDDTLLNMLLVAVLTNSKCNSNIHIWKDFDKARKTALQKTLDLKAAFQILSNTHDSHIFMKQNINLLIPFKEVICQNNQYFDIWNFALVLKTHDNIQTFFYSCDNKIRSTGNFIFSFLKELFSQRENIKYKYFQPPNKSVPIFNRPQIFHVSHSIFPTLSGLHCIYVFYTILSTWHNHKPIATLQIRTLFNHNAFRDQLIIATKKLCQDNSFENQFLFSQSSFLHYRLSGY